MNLMFNDRAKNENSWSFSAVGIYCRSAISIFDWNFGRAIDGCDFRPEKFLLTSRLTRTHSCSFVTRPKHTQNDWLQPKKWNIGKELDNDIPVGPLMPNRYNCTYVFFLFLRSNCCKNLILTLLIHKSLKHIIVSIEINHFLYKLNH